MDRRVGAVKELADLIDIIAELADALSRERNWRVKIVGRTDILPPDLARVLHDASARTEGHTGLHVNLAVGYGGRNEIVDAVRSILAEHDARGGTIQELAENLTPEIIGEHLYTGGQADPDDEGEATEASRIATPTGGHRGRGRPR